MYTTPDNPRPALVAALLEPIGPTGHRIDQLRATCHLDTLAMVELHRVLGGAVLDRRGFCCWCAAFTIVEKPGRSSLVN